MKTPETHKREKLEIEAYQCAIYEDEFGRRVFNDPRTHERRPVTSGEWMTITPVDSPGERSQNSKTRQRKGLNASQLRQQAAEVRKLLATATPNRPVRLTLSQLLVLDGPGAGEQ
jgi:hypothetical protein